MAYTAFILCSILALFCCADAQVSEEECLAEARQCAHIYFQKLLVHKGEDALLCRGVTNYLNCVYDVTCDLPSGYQNFLKTEVEDQLQHLGIHCDLPTFTGRRPHDETPVLSAQSQKSESMSCHAGIKKCGTDYAINLSMHKGNFDLVCQDVNLYLKCYLALDCGFSDAEKEDIIKGAEQSIGSVGLNCPIDPDHTATRKPLAPGVTASPCTSTSVSCLSTFMSQGADLLRNDPNNIHQLCTFMKGYLNCLERSACDSATIQNLIDTQISLMSRQHGLNCHLNTEESLQNRELPQHYGPGYVVHHGVPTDGRNAAAIGPISSLFLMAVSVFLLTLCKMFA